MSNEIAKYDYGPSKLKPLSNALFLLLFLVGGTALNILIQALLGGVLVVCSVFIAMAFLFLKGTGLAWLGWILIAPFLCVWIPINYFFQKWFVRAFSALAGMRRFQSAVIIALSTLPLLIFTLYVGFSGRTSLSAGDTVYLGFVFGFLAQIVECIRIYKLRFLPLSHFAVLPKGGKKKISLDHQLEALENARSQQEFERLTLGALADMQLGKLKLRTTTEAPIAVLLDALVKNKELNKADAISHAYLRVVENE